MSLINLLKKSCNYRLFTTPSHSQHFFVFNKLHNFYKCDISETEFHNPQVALSSAEKKAAKIYGTKSTKFLTNGSTSGIIASVIACVKKGDKVLIWENAHPCHKNAVDLAGAEAILYKIPTDKDWGVPQKTTTEIIEPYLKANMITAVIVTSPTYEGIVSDIKSIKQICEKFNTYLIVDEAHGALYPFSDKLPESAVKIADFTIQSLHKTAGGLNPTALLHTNTDLDICKALNIINTTSPSYPLLASIEANINFLNSKRGKRHIEQLINEIEDLKSKCYNYQLGGDDPTKILIKTTNLTGYELSDKLYELKIEDEKTNEISTMLLCGIGTTKNKLYSLQKALNKISNKNL